MGWNFAPLKDLPVAGWIVLLAAAAFAGEFAVLYFRKRRSAARAQEAERRLARVATAVRDRASANMQRLPSTLDEFKLFGCEAIVYRPVPRLTLDERLVLLHDREPTHKVMEFPALRDGRGLVLCNGRLLIVSEEAFEKLIAADDALRERLGLEPVAAERPKENADHGPR